MDSLILMIYSSIILSNLVISVYGDYFGRRSYLLAGSCTLITGLLLAILSPNIYLASIGLFIAFFGNEWSYTMALNFISETVNEQYRDKFSASFFVAYGIGQCGNVGFFYLLRDWKMVLIFFYIIPAAVALIFILGFIN
jgi:MFS family permease